MLAITKGALLVLELEFAGVLPLELQAARPILSATRLRRERPAATVKRGACSLPVAAALEGASSAGPIGPGVRVKRTVRVPGALDVRMLRASYLDCQQAT